MRTAFLKLSIFTALIGTFLLASCPRHSADQHSSTTESSVNEKYAFFVAGHTYGPAGYNIEGLHPPFRAKFDWIKRMDSMQFGVLTGDIVYTSSKANWDAVDASLAAIGLPVYFAAGNHDLTDREQFESRYGKTYYSFENENDLFIVLDPNIDGWDISGDQLDFLKEQLVGAKYDNIFIFFHQLIWWEPDNTFSAFLPNSTEGRAEKTNFWTEIEPVLTRLNKSVYLFAGDVGAFPYRPAYQSIMYHQHKNLTFVASGMGGCQQDNFIVVKVLENGDVDFQLISLNHSDNIATLGNIEDYLLTNIEAPKGPSPIRVRKGKYRKLMAKCLK